MNYHGKCVFSDLSSPYTLLCKFCKDVRCRWAWWGTTAAPSYIRGFFLITKAFCLLSHHLFPKAWEGREGTYYSPFIKIKKLRLKSSVVGLNEEVLTEEKVCLPSG